MREKQDRDRERRHINYHVSSKIQGMQYATHYNI